MGLGRTLCAALVGLDGHVVEVEAHVSPGPGAVGRRRAAGHGRPRGPRPGPLRAGGQPAGAAPGPGDHQPVPGRAAQVGHGLRPRRRGQRPRRGRAGARPRWPRSATWASSASTAPSAPCPGVLPAVLGLVRAGVARVVVPAGRRGRGPAGARRRGARRPLPGRGRRPAPRRAVGARARTPPARHPAVPRAAAPDDAAPPTSTCPTSSASRWAGAPWRWSPPAGTTCSCSDLPAAGRPCSRPGCPGCCRTSTTPTRSRPPRCTPSPARCGPGRLLRRPPFEAPHHTASVSAVVGGGTGLPRPGRGQPGPRRGAVPRRVPGVPPRRARRPPPAAGAGRRRGAARQGRRPPARPLPARHGRQPLPVRQRLRGGARRPLPVRPQDAAGLPRPAVRPAAGPGRRAGRGARGDARRGGRPPSRARRPRSWPPGCGRPVRRPGPGGGRRGRPTPRSPAPCSARARHRPAAAVLAPLVRGVDRGTLTARGYDRALRVAWSLADLAGPGRARRRRGGRGRVVPHPGVAVVTGPRSSPRGGARGGRPTRRTAATTTAPPGPTCPAWSSRATGGCGCCCRSGRPSELVEALRRGRGGEVWQARHDRLGGPTADLRGGGRPRPASGSSCPGDPAWPPGLDDLDDLGPRDGPDGGAPVCLWVRGELPPGDRAPRAVAVVGARAATAYGEHVAEDLAAGLVARGWTVVSGAAYGIDGGRPPRRARRRRARRAAHGRRPGRRRRPRLARRARGAAAPGGRARRGRGVRAAARARGPPPTGSCSATGSSRRGRPGRWSSRRPSGPGR